MTALASLDLTVLTLQVLEMGYIKFVAHSRTQHLITITKHWPQILNEPELCLPCRAMGDEWVWPVPGLQTSSG